KMAYRIAGEAEGRRAGAPFGMSSGTRRNVVWGGLSITFLMALAAIVGAYLWRGTTDAHAEYFCTNSSFVSFDVNATAYPGRIASVAVEQFNRQVHVYMRYKFWQEDVI